MDSLNSYKTPSSYELISIPSHGGMRTVIPYNPLWKTLIVQVSGGLDSALLLYLTAQTFKEKNSHVKILPVSFDVPYKAKNLNSARAVIKKVRDLTRYEHLLEGLEFEVPLDQCENPQKNEFIVKTVQSVKNQFDASFEFNGNTKNPPIDVRNSFPNDDLRQKDRDDRTDIFNPNFSASPHAFNDKSGIVSLYIKEGILEALAPLTLSCDMNIDVILDERLPIPCQRCWWCHERRWGFNSNNVADPATKVYQP